MSQGPNQDVDALSVSHALEHLELGMKYQLEQALGIPFARDTNTDLLQPASVVSPFLSSDVIPMELDHLDRLLKPSTLAWHPNCAQDDMIHLNTYIMYHASHNRRDWYNNESTLHRLMRWNNIDVRRWCRQIRQRVNAG